MYHHIRGTLVSMRPTLAVVEAGGVGYAVAIPLSTHRSLPAPGETCTLYTHLVVRDDGHMLYGFATEQERALFRALIGISGVGPAIALAVLSGTSPDEFLRAVEAQDVTLLKGVKGVGEKTARRIFLELRDAAALSLLEPAATAPSPAAVEAHKAAAARQALETLGLAPRAASTRVNKVLADEPELSLEETIRAALR